MDLRLAGGCLLDVFLVIRYREANLATKEDKVSALDENPQETLEWCEALADVLRENSPARAGFLLQQVVAQASRLGLPLPGLTTPYVNTIACEDEKKIPEDHGVARRLRALIRWNALIMVLRAGKKAPELGGHIASYASIATLYEVGFNHFFHAPTKDHGGDLVFFQGHSSPGLYARSFLEGRLSEAQLDHFRQEVRDDGLTSYPHPWLMPDYWQFATVSMGLGPIQAIYQARFLKYLHHRGLQDTSARKVWCFCGDGEMDEPESLGALTVAAREGLDNLIFVVNCNLQRLDGPVRGNGKIIQELEALFRGAGWHVLKVIWGRRWDPLLAQDKNGILERRMNEAIDGDYQNYKAHDGAYVREHFFGASPELAAMVADMSDDEIWRLNRGGLDAQKVFAAYSEAATHKGQPTVILAKTIKGFGMGEAGEGLNITHQQKKMTTEQIKTFRERFDLPIEDAEIERLNFHKPADDSPEIQFLKQQRAKLGGEFPLRKHSAHPLQVPGLAQFKALTEGSGEREISTTMAMVRLLNILVKDAQIGQQIVPIVPDESRTFGMEGLFRQLGIYSPVGQLYTPVDAAQIMYYREEKDGQILQEGLNEGGAFCSWIAAATSYSNNGLPMIPMYLYYSMFGFQRIGDLAFAAGDMQARGFLLGCVAGRTTLAGEGLQHQDGHSHIMAATIPNCVTYDPTFSYELAVIMAQGLKRMYVDEDNVYYYVTLMNENYVQPAMPPGVEDGIIKGMYLLQEESNAKVQLMGCGTILMEVLKAAERLKVDFDLSANVWSVTSFNELAREGMEVERHNRLQVKAKPKQAYVSQCLQRHTGPVIAATDYMRAYAEQIRAYVPKAYTVLGTDGYGRSDTRQNLRYFFEVNADYIAYSAVKALVDAGDLPKTALAQALKCYQIDVNKPDPWTV